MNERKAREIVYARSKGICEIQHAGVCQGAATEFSHRKGRSQGGEWTPSNGLHACHACHMWCHAHPFRAYDKGWMVHSWEDPKTAPVVLWPTGIARLDDEGGFTTFHPDDVGTWR